MPFWPQRRPSRSILNELVLSWRLWWVWAALTRVPKWIPIDSHWLYYPRYEPLLFHIRWFIVKDQRIRLQLKRFFIRISKTILLERPLIQIRLWPFRGHRGDMRIFCVHRESLLEVLVWNQRLFRVYENIWLILKFRRLITLISIFRRSLEVLDHRRRWLNILAWSVSVRRSIGLLLFLTRVRLNLGHLESCILITLQGHIFFIDSLNLRRWVSYTLRHHRWTYLQRGRIDLLRRRVYLLWCRVNSYRVWAY